MARLRLATLLAALLVLALPAPGFALQKMMWAVDGRGVDQVDVMRDLRVDVLEVIVPWSSVAPTRPANPTDPNDPAYHWSPATDALVSAAARRGLRVAVLLATSPGWSNGNRDAIWAPNDPADFARFATATARHYAGVHLWMVWREPIYQTNFQPLIPEAEFTGAPLRPDQLAGPHAYARLVDAAYGALKARSRRNLVVGGMSVNGGDIRPVNWVENLQLPNGKPPRMDLYGHNPFSARRPDLRNPPSHQEGIDFSDLGRFQYVINRYLARPRHKRRLRLFLSEFTIPTAPDHEFPFHTSLRTQARWITSAFRVARRLDAYGLGWIYLQDVPGVHTGGLIFSNGKHKPGYSAFRRG
jgi:hypothetical protein